MESNVQTFHIQGNAKNYITWRWTTWNDVICSCASNEIMKIDYERVETLSNLLQSFEIYCCQKQIGLTCFRFKVPHKDLQKELVKIGFYYAESAFVFFTKRLQRLVFKGAFMPLTRATPKDFSQISKIVETTFMFGRFHEDPFVDIKQAQKRYAYWTKQLEEKRNFWIYKKLDKVLCFAIFWQENDTVVLDLVGCQKGSGYLFFGFLESLLLSLQKRGIKNIRPFIVSAHNITAVQTYLSLGLQIQKSLLGFHKSRNLH